MPDITRSALLPYSAERVYDLVNDVASYPQFMEGCVGAEIISSSDSEMVARLHLSRAKLKYSFTTRNQLLRPSSVIMQLVDGPFKDFSGEWTLQPLNDSACKVTLHLSFTLESRALALAAKALFNPMADNLVNALVNRAKHLHG